MPQNEMSRNSLVERLHHGLIVSCQPVPGGPMDAPSHIVAMALAAVNAGAKGLRIEGVENVKAVAKATDAPIVGIVKRDLDDYDIRITPYIEDVRGLAAAGASLIAFDATARARPVAVEQLLKAVHECGAVAMADCATYAEGRQAAALGCELIGSTLSGYIGGETPPDAPDFDLVAQWSREGLKVIAEGRYNTPALAAEAIKRGAFAVTVGSAITRVEHIVSWYCRAIDSERL